MATVIGVPVHLLVEEIDAVAGASRETIAAISTPPGRGGIGVIRVSGGDALSVASSILREAPEWTRAIPISSKWCLPIMLCLIRAWRHISPRQILTPGKTPSKSPYMAPRLYYELVWKLCARTARASPSLASSRCEHS